MSRVQLSMYATQTFLSASILNLIKHMSRKEMDVAQQNMIHLLRHSVSHNSQERQLTSPNEERNLIASQRVELSPDRWATIWYSHPPSHIGV